MFLQVASVSTGSSLNMDSDGSHLPPAMVCSSNKPTKCSVLLSQGFPIKHPLVQGCSSPSHPISHPRYYFSLHRVITCFRNSSREKSSLCFVHFIVLQHLVRIHEVTEVDESSHGLWDAIFTVSTERTGPHLCLVPSIPPSENAAMALRGIRRKLAN